MAGHFGIGKLNIDASAAGAAPCVAVQFVPGAHVGKKVAVPIGAPAPGLIQIGLRNHLRFGVEIHLVLDIRAFVGIAKDEIHIAHAGKRKRHIVIVKQTRRLVALHIGELVRVIVRHEKHAVLLPLEGFFRPFLAGPNRCKAASFNNIDDFVESKLERRQRFAGRNLGHSRRRDAFLSDQLNERGTTLARAPPAEL